MSDLIIPGAMKGISRAQVVKIAWLYLNEFKMQFMLERENSNDLKNFLEYIDKKFHEKEAELRKKDNFFVRFADGSAMEIGKNSPEMRQIQQNDMLEALYFSAKLIYALARLFWDSNPRRPLDLTVFMEWSATYLKENYAYNQAIK